VKTSIPGFYNTFKNKLRNLQQGCDTTVWLCVEDAGKLQPGAFYLDRRQQPKHLPLGGTSYSGADVDVLWQKLEAMALPALPVAAPDAL
jgi:dehydrogenase/reductase SDR family protein 12